MWLLLGVLQYIKAKFNSVWDKKVKYAYNNFVTTVSGRTFAMQVILAFIPNNSSPEQRKDNVEHQWSPDHEVIYPRPIVCI